MVIVIVSTLSPLDDNRWSYLVEVTESGGSGSKTRHKVSKLLLEWNHPA